MKYLVVVDVQNDFVNGTLGTKEAEVIYPRVLEKIKSFEGTVVLTKDTHDENYLDTQEGQHLPVIHCVKGTSGWQFSKELDALRRDKKLEVYEKPTFGSTKLMEDFKILNEVGRITSIELVGLCTDICVISNALLLKAAMQEVPIYVDSSCCAGVTPEKHDAALQVMQSCQIIVN